MLSVKGWSAALKASFDLTQVKGWTFQPAPDGVKGWNFQPVPDGVKGWTTKAW
jgi:hypothetical protein